MTVILSFAAITLFILISMNSVEGQHKLTAYEVCDNTGRLESVTVIPCTKEPCEFFRGTNLTVVLTGAFAGCETNSTRGKASVVLANRRVTLPGVRAEFCGENDACRPSDDGIRTARITVPILTIYPNMTTDVTLTVGCDKKQVQACVEVVFTIRDEYV